MSYPFEEHERKGIIGSVHRAVLEVLSENGGLYEEALQKEVQQRLGHNFSKEKFEDALRHFIPHKVLRYSPRQAFISDKEEVKKWGKDAGHNETVYDVEISPTYLKAVRNFIAPRVKVHPR